MLKVFLSVGFLQILTMFALLVRTKSLALLLGPEQLGIMAVVDRLLAVFVQAASLSMPFAALRFLSAQWHHERAEYFSLLRRMSNVLLVMVFLAGAAGTVLAWRSPAVLGAELVPYRPVLLAAFATLPVLGLVPFLKNVIASRFEHNRSMLFSLGHALLFAATAVVGVWWRGLAGLYLLYAVFGLAFLGFVLRNLSPARTEETAQPVICPPPGEPVVGPPPGEPPTPARSPFHLPRRVWKFSLSFLGLAFLSPYAALYVGYQILSRNGGEAAGWMQAAVGISLAVRGVLGAANQVFLTPHVNREGSFEERARWANAYQRTLLLLVGVLVPPILLFPQVAVQVLYSSEFLPGARFVMLFVVAEILGLCAGIYQAIVIAMDHIAFHVVQSIGAQLLMLLVAYLLIPQHGIAGAGLAMLALYLWLLVVPLCFLRWRHGIRVPGNVAFLLVYVLVALSLAGALGVSYPGLALGALAVKLTSFLGLAGGLAFFLSADDWARLGRLIQELRQRATKSGSP